MTRDEFKKYTAETIESVFQEAERYAGRSLPRRFCFGYINPNRVLAEQEEAAEFITQIIFIDENHIYPCFDLFFGDILDGGRLLFVGYRANFPPREFYRGYGGPIKKQISKERYSHIAKNFNPPPAV